MRTASIGDRVKMKPRAYEYAWTMYGHTHNCYGVVINDGPRRLDRDVEMLGVSQYVCMSDMYGAPPQ